MENNNTRLQEQEAPIKNTDNAFVQVGHNGEPIMPAKEDSGKEEKGEKAQPAQEEGE